LSDVCGRDPLCKKLEDLEFFWAESINAVATTLRLEGDIFHRVLPSWEVKIMDKSLIFIEKQVYKNVTHFGGQIPKGFEVFLRGHPCHIDGQFECDQSQYRSTDFHYAS
jgi:hypothetical protein